MRESRRFNPEKLNKAIKRSGKNIPKLCEESGVPRTTLYDWSHGRTMPSADYLKLLAGCLGVPMEELIE